MKHWYLIPLAAIAGLIAGSWGPRADLAKLKDLQETEKSERAARPRSGGFGAIADLANVPSRASRSRMVKADEPARTEEVGETNAVDVAENETETNDVEIAQTRERVSPEDLRARIDEASELWRTRAEIAKTQWKSKLDLTDEGAAQFDEAIETMNDSLRETMVAAAEEIAQSGKLSTELGIKLMSAMTETLSQTYDAVGNIAPAEKRAEVSEMKLHDFVDPSVIEPLVSVQGLLDNDAGVEIE